MLSLLLWLFLLFLSQKLFTVLYEGLTHTHTHTHTHAVPECGDVVTAGGGDHAEGTVVIEDTATVERNPLFYYSPISLNLLLAPPIGQTPFEAC